MIGQGSPTTSRSVLSFCKWRRVFVSWRQFLVLLSLCTVAAQADEPTMQLRIAWGGGQSNRWVGSISISEGTLSSPRPLGVDADEPGSLELTKNVLRVAQPSDRDYDGVDVLIHAPLSALVKIELAPHGDLQQARQFSASLEEVMIQYKLEPLDEQGNRVLIGRSPGDRLRIKLARDHLVFGPGETFKLDVSAHLLGIAEDTSVRLKTQLVTVPEGKELWSTAKDLRVNENGELGKLELTEIPLPEEEGVYDILLSVIERRYLRPRFVAARPTVSRSIQIVVIDSKAPEHDPSLLVFDDKTSVIDPIHPNWWQRWQRPLAVIPGFDKGPLTNGRSRPWSSAPDKFLELDVGGWLAYPVNVSRPGAPHILEVEYPSDHRQTLGISLLEPNSSGEITPIGVDSGVDVTVLKNPTPDVLRHRMIVWPKTKNPVLLLTNRREDGPAVFGKVQILSGPDRLSRARPLGSDNGERLMAAYFSHPLFTEMFSAKQGFDTLTSRSLDDWSTFYQGGTRLVEYLAHAGYNAAAISVFHEGSTIYPSELLEPTPKYDMGVFFSNGQDPIRKDVLEMLFRLFDREQLKLIPEVQFSSPLPELERKLHQGRSATVGIEPVGHDGRSWMKQQGSPGGTGHYYNPLDDRVQQAMLDVIRELVSRYEQHTSFGGLSLQLNSHGYASLPGTYWCLDDNTFARFQVDSQVPLQASGPDRHRKRAELLHENAEVRTKWLNWRSVQLFQFYRRLHAEVNRVNPACKLYLSSHDLLERQEIKQALRPSLLARAENSLAQSLLELGLDVSLFHRRNDICFLRPWRLGPVFSLSAQGVDYHLNTSTDVDRFFRGGQSAGGLLFHKTHELQVPEFDQVSPFGTDKTFTKLATRFTSAAGNSRQRFVHSIASLDAPVIFDGGWMPTLGQEGEIQSLLNTFCRLPAVPFQAVTANTPTQPVTIRAATVESQTFVYLVNDSPWKVSVDLKIVVPLDVNIESLTTTESLLRLDRSSHHSNWKVELPPYQLTAARIHAPDIPIEPVKVDLPATAVAGLRRRISELQRRAKLLSLKADPLDVLTNPGFEQPSEGARIPGWVSGKGTPLSVSRDPGKAKSGTSALHIRNTDGVQWLRSEPFQPPKTGRLSLWVSLRVDDPQQQPSFRLAVECQQDGKTFYRTAPVGAGSGVKPISDRWFLYSCQVDDLPTEGATDMRVGFDLFGQGDVWIDDVQVFDLSFSLREKHELSKILGLANFHLEKDEYADCARVLNSYWPRFLQSCVELPQARMVKQLPPPEVTPQEQPAPGTWERVKELFRPQRYF